MAKPTSQIEVKPRITARNSRKNSIAQHGNTQARLNPISLSQTMQCRICLEENHQNSKLFMKPCLCSGSVSFVHKQCLQTWIKQRINKANPQEQQRVIQKQAIACQMCKSEISFSFEWKLQQIKCRQILNRIQGRPCISVLLFTSLILVMFGLGFVVFMMQKFGINFTGNNQIESIILTVSIVLLPFFFILTVYLIFDEFVLTYEFTIELTGPSHQILLPVTPNKIQRQFQNSNVIKKEEQDSTNYKLVGHQQEISIKPKS